MSLSLLPSEQAMDLIWMNLKKDLEANPLQTSALGRNPISKMATSV
jgi:hypothetical protein